MSDRRRYTPKRLDRDKAERSRRVARGSLPPWMREGQERVHIRRKPIPPNHILSRWIMVRLLNHEPTTEDMVLTDEEREAVRLVLNLLNR